MKTEPILPSDPEKGAPHLLTTTFPNENGFAGCIAVFCFADKNLVSVRGLDSAGVRQLFREIEKLLPE